MIVFLKKSCMSCYNSFESVSVAFCHLQRHILVVSRTPAGSIEREFEPLQECIFWVLFALFITILYSAPSWAGPLSAVASATSANRC